VSPKRENVGRRLWAVLGALPLIVCGSLWASSQAMTGIRWSSVMGSAMQVGRARKFIVFKTPSPPSVRAACEVVRSEDGRSVLYVVHPDPVMEVIAKYFEDPRIERPPGWRGVEYLRVRDGRVLKVAWWLATAAALPFLLPTVLVGYRWRRRSRWIRTGRCAQCGYPLVGLVTGRCPECGTLSTTAPVHTDGPCLGRHGHSGP
jgi:hypothetical protein